MTLPLLVAAPMAGGPTTPDLVAAVAAAGSIAFVPAGYRTAAQLAGDVATVRDRSRDFGVNLFVPEREPVDRAAVLAYRAALAGELAAAGVEPGPERWDDDDDWDAKVDLLVADPVPWVSFTFGLPDAIVVRRLRGVGSRILLTVTDVAEARAAEALAPDALVVQASAAGGHRGTFDQRRTPGDGALTDLVAEVAAVTSVPIVAAGGVAGPAQVRAALEAGASSVAVGTALLLADEAGTRPVHRAALADPTSDTATMRAWTGRVARGIRTTFSDRFDPMAPPAYPAVHHLTAPLRRAAAEAGDREHVHLWAGTGFRTARRGQVADLLAQLVP